MEGGEGYDWYYASGPDRAAQIRTPITDGLAEKPWVFRYKDIRNWWARTHYNRTGGTEAATPTDWAPQSKPIWFTEIGCPAIDKGANQPNVFVDPKSSESVAPYFSSGGRDDLIQRRYLESFLTYWETHNPISTVYAGPMVDMDAAHVWCWDARPFPDFPARSDVWSDGTNWTVGHWISGRTGLVPLADIIRDITAQSGVGAIDVSRVQGLLEGYVIDRPMSAAAALEPLLTVYGIHMATRADRLTFISQGLEDKTDLFIHDIAETGAGDISEHFPDAEQSLLDVRVHYIDAARDYQPAVASARGHLEETIRSADIHVPIIMGEGQARRIAERFFSVVNREQFFAELTLSPSRPDIETGDVASVPGLDGAWRVENMDGIDARQVILRRIDSSAPTALSGTTPSVMAPVPWVGPPEIIVLDIPDIDARGARQGVLVGAAGIPFHPVRVTGPDGEAALTEPIAAGNLLTDMARGPAGRWDRATICEIHMPDIDLASVDGDALLAGANRFAVKTDSGWEVIQARDISLVGENQYRLSHMLRGLAGTDADMMDIVPSGAQIVYLNRGLKDLPISPARLGGSVTVTAEAGGRGGDPITLIYAARHLRPLSPVHPKLTVNEDGLHLSWVRRTGLHGDSWAGLDVPLGEEREFYRVRLLDGDNVLATYESEKSELSVSSAAWGPLSVAITQIQIQQGSTGFGYGAALYIDDPAS